MVRQIGKHLMLWGALTSLLFSAPPAFAGPLRDLIAGRLAGQGQESLLEEDSAALKLPEGIRIERDIPYGPDSLQRMDVYTPPDARSAPVIFMVHGGGWRRGDKNNSRVVENKVARWVPRGFVFISVNYRLLPDAAPLVQVQDVTLALATAQEKAASWGGDRSRFILMGHSAGAHLVAMLNADPQQAYRAGATPWLGAIFLDSAALNVVQTMTDSHFRLYDQAFGKDPGTWKELSPFHHLSPSGPPALAVCSTRRRDDPCAAAREFAGKAESLGRRVAVLPEDLSHREINALLGEDPPYTEAVETFMGSLDAGVAGLLSAGPGVR